MEYLNKRKSFDGLKSTKIIQSECTCIDWSRVELFLFKKVFNFINKSSNLKFLRNLIFFIRIKSWTTFSFSFQVEWFYRIPLMRLGLYSTGSSEHNSYRWKWFMILFILIQYSSAPIFFLLFEAGTFREYADSFYIFATASLKVCTFSVTLCKRKWLKLMDDYENTINSRKNYGLNSTKIMRNYQKMLRDNYHIKTERNEIFRNNSKVPKIRHRKCARKWIRK